MKKLLSCIIAFCFINIAVSQNISLQKFKNLPTHSSPQEQNNDRKDIDWLLGKAEHTAAVFKSKNGKDLIMTNGLISREFRMQPYFACFSFRNLMTPKEMIRAIQPEAQIEIDGTHYNIGGVKGQFEYAYMKYDWLEKFTSDPAAFQLKDFEIKNIQTRFPWKAKRWTLDKQWPPKGKEIIFYFEAPEQNTARN